ncbi:hypothetical protein QN372_18865 [Undibacterium sp. RTI2.1]|uniref:hypothetical protein n=1 Tax=unclassified Undibacterium TaxID=2630295 RepID=UPI002B236376|nr:MULTISPECIES: hypothetical protein [unclassified Undibacterium]MEB0032815.1 hypothetical protein [Undibacterium sp. RTI2.1]MEB0116469.1 hypothetical protein [Undibacterium sp. RTI2.2]
MKHSMMRVAVAATLGFSALAANAGQIGVNVGSTLAAEYITSTVVVAQPTITYQTASLINDGAAVQVHVRFGSGSTKAADGGVLPNSLKANAVANPADVALFLNGTAYPIANYSLSAATADTDGLGYYFTLTSIAGTGGVPAGTVINMNGATARIAKLSAALGVGGTVTTTVGYTVTPGDTSGVTSYVEPVSTATLLTSSKALSQATINSNALAAGIYATAEAKKVDVNNAVKQFVGTSPVVGTAGINLGSTKLVVNTALKTPAGANAAAADFGTSVFTATGDFSAAAVAGVFLASDQACTTSVAAGTVSTDKKSVTFAAITSAVATVNNYLCYTTNTTTVLPFNVQYAIGGATVAANGAVTNASTQTGANTYLLTSNGAAVYVPSFVVTGSSVNDYNTYLRIYNTGSLTAPVSVQAINPAGIIVGTALVSSMGVNGTVASGGSVIVGGSAVSAALGLTSGVWYTLLVTAPTTQLSVQPLMVNPGSGVISNIGGINGLNNGTSAQN